jgi:hypothetical protein
MNYLIDYEFYDDNNDIIKAGMMRVENCQSELHAKIRLEKYLALKYPNFNRLVVHRCTPDIDLSFFTNMFGFK